MSHARRLGGMGDQTVVRDMDHERGLGFAIPLFGRRVALCAGLVGKIVGSGLFLPLAI